MTEIQRGPLLSLERVSVRYGTVTACEDVSLSVEPGDVYILVGAHGSGKSSILRCGVGLRRPSSGRVRLLGKDAWKSRRELSQRVAFLPQLADAHPAPASQRLIELFRRGRELRGLDEVRDRLARLGVAADVPPARFSPREKMAALLALVWKKAPELVIIDEPSSSLDLAARRMLYEEIVGELSRRGSGVLVAIDQAAEIEPFATRVGFLDAGRLVIDGPVDHLKSRFRRIRYKNRVTETRTEYGNELDLFDAVQVKVRGWGIDAIVSNYDERIFETFSKTDGVEDAEVLPVTLDEIRSAVARRGRGETPGRPA